jgi:transposase InsO family protein
MKEQGKQCHTTALCKVLNVSPSAYYQWLKDPDDKRGREEKELCEKILDLFAESCECYGSRRIFRRLRKECIRCSRRRVCKLMRELGIMPKRRRRFRITTDSKHKFKAYPNLLDRNFYVSAADKAWVSDITYIWTDEGWLFLTSVIDLYSRRVVGWSMSGSLKSRIALNALDMAVKARRPAAGLVHHSDRGVQYDCGDYQKALRADGIRCSMSRKGDCWDNSVAESFFSTLKKELIYRKTFATRKGARRDILDFIEVFYSRQRIHSYLGHMSPVEFEAAAA